MLDIRTITTKFPDPPIVPDDTVGPFLPMEQHDLDVFNEIVGDEIDSDFASSIACCDACYTQFKDLWPGVAFRDIEFQSQGMEVQWLVDNLRLVDLYSPAELSTLRHFVSCPRCRCFIQQPSGAPSVPKEKAPMDCSVDARLGLIAGWSG